MKVPAFLGIAGVVLIAWALYSRLGGLSAAAAVLGIALLISVPVLLVRRLFPSVRKGEQASQELAARKRERLAQYKRAGLHISHPFLRGTVISGQHAGVRLIELLLSLPLLAPALVGALALANERFDGTAAEEHQVRLVRHWYTSGAKRGAHFHLEFESWRGRDREQLLNVGEPVYALARAGQIWQLRVRRGWLNHPWVESMRPISRP